MDHADVGQASEIRTAAEIRTSRSLTWIRGAGEVLVGQHDGGIA
jgi:hypothetical protein